MYKIITIAREYGSGGRLIAKKVAEKLGIAYYDNEIIDLVAKESGMDVDMIRKTSEVKTSPFLYSSSNLRNRLPLNDNVYTMQYKIIRHLANQGSCIIVNGCADYILEDFDDVLTIFIHAPLSSRIERVKNDYQENYNNYIKAVRKKDKQRADYYNYYTTKKWGHLNNFDLTINSDLGIEEVSDIIVEVFKKDL